MTRTQWLTIDDFTEVEQALHEAVEFGYEVDAEGGEVRAEALFQILTGAGLHPRPFRRLHLIHATITGTLDLTDERLQGTFEFGDCTFPERAILDGAQGQGITFRRCTMARGLTGRHLRVRRDFDLEDSKLPNVGKAAQPQLTLDAATILGDLRCRGLEVDGTSILTRATITGEADFRSARLTNPGGIALWMMGTSVIGDLNCGAHFTAKGEVNLDRATVGGRVYFSASRVENRGGVALSMDHALLGADLICNGLRTIGEVRLLMAQVSGQISFEGACLIGTEGVALGLDGVVIGNHLFCDGGFSSKGSTRLLSASVGGQVSFAQARLDGAGGLALCLDDAAIRGDVLCDYDFAAKGSVSLIGTRVGGSVAFGDAFLSEPDEGNVLRLDRAEISGDLNCGSGFIARGGVRLADATIRGQACFSSGYFAKPSGMAIDGLALNMDRADIGELDCDGFQVDGTVSMTQASIAKSARVSATWVPGGGVSLALRAAGTRVRTSLELDLDVPRSSEERHAQVDLRDARLGVLACDSPDSLPATQLDGLSVGGLAASRSDTSGRVAIEQWMAWFAKDPDGYSPAPYASLSRVLLESGDETAARKVKVASQEARFNEFGPLRRLWGQLEKWTVGYGYHPARALAWLIAWLVLGSIILWWPHPPTWMPSTSWWSSFTATVPGTPSRTVAAEGVTRPWIYLIDLVLPILDLPAHRTITTDNQSANYFLVGWLLLGWALAIAAIAGITGRLTRQDNK